MASTGVIGKGTTLSYGATPTLLGQMTEYNGPDFSGKPADITNMDSPALGDGVSKEFLPGEGSFKFSAKLVYLSATATSGYAILNTSQSFTLTLPKFGTQTTSGDKYVFSGILTGWKVTGTTSEKTMVDVDVEVSGTPVFTIGT